MGRRGGRSRFTVRGSEFGVWSSVFAKRSRVFGLLTPVTPGLPNFSSLRLCEFRFGVWSSVFAVHRTGFGVRGSEFVSLQTQNRLPINGLASECAICSGKPAIARLT